MLNPNVEKVLMHSVILLSLEGLAGEITPIVSPSDNFFLSKSNTS